MPILRLNTGSDGLTIDGSPAPALTALRQAARGTGPVMIMTHGYKYTPWQAANNPHTTIFAAHTRPDRMWETLWPRQLGFGAGHCDEGLAICFGWHARGHLWRAQKRAVLAGQALANVIETIREVAPSRAVHVITHSMGSEVVLEALLHLPAHSLNRVITLTAASYVSRATEALQSPAGRTTELFNVTTRENDVFDLMYERLIPAPQNGDRALGSGLQGTNVVNIQLDCVRSLETLSAFGAEIAKSDRKICHWSGYTRPGALRFYARVMRTPHAVPIRPLQRLLPQNAARWSRLKEGIDLTGLAPAFGKATV